MKNIISKFITSVCEKNYAEADSLLQNIISEKVKNKIKKIAHNKKEIEREKEQEESKAKKNDKKAPKKTK